MFLPSVISNKMLGISVINKLKFSTSSVHYFNKLLTASKCNPNFALKSLILCRNIHERFTDYSVRNYCILSNFDPSKHTIKNVLFHYGFIEGDINKILEKYPNLNEIPAENLITTLNCWLMCQTNEKSLTSLVLKHPNLLCVSPKKIEKLYLLLSSMYTNDYVYAIFSNSPQLLMDSIETVKEKISFLEDEMLAPKAEIANTTALGHSLHHIRERYEFLRRVGVYKRNDKKNIDHDNPRLDQIVCSSSKYFATKVAGVTLLEYEVFQQLFLEEQD